MPNIFMGTFTDILKEVLKYIYIDLVVVENKPANKDVVSYCREHNIKYTVVDNYDAVTECLARFDSIKLCFVASFGIILKNDLIKKCNYVVNFHPGDVACCRGRHPLPAAILNKHVTMGATVHLIDSEEIDAGPILVKTLLPIDYTTSYKDNEKKLIEAMRSLVPLLVREYMDKGRFSTYSWEYEDSAYYKPLCKEILSEIMAAEILEAEIQSECYN